MSLTWQSSILSIWVFVPWGWVMGTKNKGADGSRLSAVRGLGLPVIHDNVEHQLRFWVYNLP